MENDGYFYQGEDVTIKYRVDDLPVTAGWTAVWRMFDAGGSVLLTITPAYDTPVQGYLTVTIPHAETVSLPPANYRNECRRIDAGYNTLLGALTFACLASLSP